MLTIPKIRLAKATRNGYAQLSPIKVWTILLILIFRSINISNISSLINPTFLGQNIAEALVAKGIAVPIKHRHDDDNRSSQYDDLREAEKNAMKALKGIHSKSLPPQMHVTDVSQEVPKARAFLTFLKGTVRDSHTMS